MSLIPGVDFKTVQWKPTMQLHLIRSVSAGIVWAVVLFLTVGNSNDGPPWWAMPFMLPLVYFVGTPFYLVIAKAAAAFGDMGKAFGGFIILALAIGIVVGDPLVYILSQQRPDLVPVERFGFMNFVVVMFVHPPQSGVAVSL